jgi:hypothetical protein
LLQLVQVAHVLPQPKLVFRVQAAMPLVVSCQNHHTTEDMVYATALIPLRKL